MGSLIGVIVGLLIILPFSGYIEQQMLLPFLLPNVPIILATALAAIALGMFSGGIAGRLSAYRVTQTETGLLLREEQ